MIIVFSVGLKENTSVSFVNRSQFFDLSLLSKLDDTVEVILNSCTIIYPFRFLLFLAHFRMSEPLRDHVNTLYRTLPGVGVYLLLVLIIALGWSMGYWL